MDLKNFSVLEEKINNLLSAAKQLRKQNAKLTKQNEELQSQIEGQNQLSTDITDLKEQLEKANNENQALLKERDSVKNRVEALINELDSINLSDSSSELFSEEK